MILPQQSITLLPATTTPLPAGCATPYHCSIITSSPASTRAIPYDVELFVPRVTTTVQSDQPTDAMPGPSSITISNLSPSVNCVLGLDRNLTGHGRSWEVMDCSPSSVAGHQQPESPNTSVRPIALVRLDCISLDLVIHPGCTISTVSLKPSLPSLALILDGADLCQYRDGTL